MSLGVKYIIFVFVEKVFYSLSVYMSLGVKYIILYLLKNVFYSLSVYMSLGVKYIIFVFVDKCVLFFVCLHVL